MIKNIGEIWNFDDVARQVLAYRQLEKEYKAGNGFGGIIIKYYDIPKEEYDKWLESQKEKEKGKSTN